MQYTMTIIGQRYNVLNKNMPYSQEEELPKSVGKFFFLGKNFPSVTK